MKGTVKPVATPLDPKSPAFAARRAEARKALDAIDPAMRGEMTDPLRRDWFEAVYALAEDDPARVPWANLAPHPLTRTWIGLQAKGVAGLSVLDVGCGLGDNAECFAAHGARVAAFDFIADAVAWAKRRFPKTSVDYRTADLFALPEALHGQFDLVHECYTLQALSYELVPRAMGIFRALLKPQGRLLIVARSRAEDEKTSGPPWPLPPSFFQEAEAQGLRCLALEDIAPTAELRSRHWRALLGPH